MDLPNRTKPVACSVILSTSVVGENVASDFH